MSAQKVAVQAAPDLQVDVTPAVVTTPVLPGPLPVPQALAPQVAVITLPGPQVQQRPAPQPVALTVLPRT